VCWSQSLEHDTQGWLVNVVNTCEHIVLMVGPEELESSTMGL